MSLRTAIMAKAEADTGAGGLVTLLGSVNQLLPRAGVQPPPAARPWGILEIGQSVQTFDTITYTQTFRWSFFDDIGRGYHMIDALIGRAKIVYPFDSGQLYLDYGGVAYHQELTYESMDMADDTYKQLVRWVEWTLWRA